MPRHIPRHVHRSYRVTASSPQSTGSPTEDIINLSTDSPRGVMGLDLIPEGVEYIPQHNNNEGVGRRRNNNNSNNNSMDDGVFVDDDDEEEEVENRVSTTTTTTSSSNVNIYRGHSRGSLSVAQQHRRSGRKVHVSVTTNNNANSKGNRDESSSGVDSNFITPPSSPRDELMNSLMSSFSSSSSSSSASLSSSHAHITTTTSNNNNNKNNSFSWNSRSTRIMNNRSSKTGMDEDNIIISNSNKSNSNKSNSNSNNNNNNNRSNNNKKNSRGGVDIDDRTNPGVLLLDEVEEELKACQARTFSSKAAFRTAMQRLSSDLRNANETVVALEEQLANAIAVREERFQRYEWARDRREHEVEAMGVERAHLEILKRCLQSPVTREMISQTRIGEERHEMKKQPTLFRYRDETIQEVRVMKNRLDGILHLFQKAEKAKESTNIALQAQGDAMMEDATSKYILYHKFRQI